MTKNRNILLSFDEQGNESEVTLFCFKSDVDALEFWRLILMLPVHTEKLMFPIMVTYDREDTETKSKLETLFHAVFDREER